MAVDFGRDVARLKDTPRQGWADRLSVEDPESVADHSFSAAMLGMVLADELGLDAEKTLRMALLHDIAEARTGDITPGSMGRDEKLNLERAAMRDMLSKLPPELQGRYGDAWEEYAAQATPEAQLVGQVDKLEMALQASIYAAKGHPAEGLEPFLQTARERITHPRLKELLSEIERTMERTME